MNRSTVSGIGLVQRNEQRITLLQFYQYIPRSVFAAVIGYHQSCLMTFALKTLTHTMPFGYSGPYIRLLVVGRHDYVDLFFAHFVILFLALLNVMYLFSIN